MPLEAPCQGITKLSNYKIESGFFYMIGVAQKVSSKYSLKEQLRLPRQKAKTNEVVEYVDEGISVEYLYRPALTKLREDVKNGLIDKVNIYDPDRLSRKLSNSLLVPGRSRKACGFNVFER